MKLQCPITFAVVGVGRIGARHAEQIAGTDGFQLAAVCDCSEEAIAKFSAESEAEGVQVFDDYQKMVDAGPAQVMVIATPSHLHYDMTLAAIQAGMNVLVEKPMASSAKEGKEMLAAAERAGVFLTVHQSVRYQPDTQMIREVIESGQLGDVFSIYRSEHMFSERKDWQIWKEYYGGAVSNLAVHWVDAGMLMIDDDPAAVFARFHRILDQGDAEDCFKIVVRYRGGQTIEAELVRAYFPKAMWHVSGTRGAAWIANTLPKITMHVKTLDGEEWSRDYDFTTDQGNVPLFYADFAEKLLRGEDPPVTPQSVIRQLQVIDAARESDATGQSAAVDLS